MFYITKLRNTLKVLHFLYGVTLIHLWNLAYRGSKILIYIYERSHIALRISLAEDIEIITNRIKGIMDNGK